MQTQAHTHHIPATGTGNDDEWSQTKLRLVAAAGILVLAAGLVFGMVISTTGDASADPEPAATHGLDQAPVADESNPGTTTEGDTDKGTVDDGTTGEPAADAAASDGDEPAAPADEPEGESEDAEETPEEDPEDPVDPVDPMDGAPDDFAPVPEDPGPGFEGPDDFAPLPTIPDPTPIPGPDDLAPLPTIPDPTPICCIVLPPVVPDPDPVPPVIDGKIINP